MLYANALHVCTQYSRNAVIGGGGIMHGGAQGFYTYTGSMHAMIQCNFSSAITGRCGHFTFQVFRNIMKLVK